MESQPQNPESRINPENFHPSTFFIRAPLSFFLLAITQQLYEMCCFLWPQSWFLNCPSVCPNLNHVRNISAI